MRGKLVITVGVLILAVAASTIFFSRRSTAPPAGPGTSGVSPGPAAPSPPVEPALALEIDTAKQVELQQGTPFVFTVRISNPRAANAAAANQLNAQVVDDLQQRVARGELTAVAAQPMLEAVRASEPVEAIRAGTDARGWETFLHFERVADGGSALLDWPLTLVATPESRSVTLDATSVAKVQYAVSPQAAAQIQAGTYQVVAAFEVPAGLDLPAGTWRGRVVSRPVTIVMAAAGAQPPGGDQGNANLRRAEYFKVIGDWASAAQAAQAALNQNPQLIGAQIVLGNAREAQGDLVGARDAYVRARRLFYEQQPNSYEAPEYLDVKIAELNQRIGPG